MDSEILDWKELEKKMLDNLDIDYDSFKLRVHPSDLLKERKAVESLFSYLDAEGFKRNYVASKLKSTEWHVYQFVR
jgi:hypothetical protein